MNYELIRSIDLTKVTEEQNRSAALTVATNARDADEAKMLLSMLGLHQ